MLEPKVPKPPKEFTEKVKSIIRERSGGICESCGRKPATDFHHRQYKSRGGRGTVANGLHLCGMGNVLGCHGAAHNSGSAALDTGLSIRSGGDPEKVQVVYRGHRVYLTADGGLKEVT